MELIRNTKAGQTKNKMEVDYNWLNQYFVRIQVYWASLFILPKEVIKEVQQCLAAFLWSRVDLNTKVEKIAWHEVCKDQKKGNWIWKIQHYGRIRALYQDTSGI